VHWRRNDQLLQSLPAFLPKNFPSRPLNGCEEKKYFLLVLIIEWLFLFGFFASFFLSRTLRTGIMSILFVFVAPVCEEIDWHNLMMLRDLKKKLKGWLDRDSLHSSRLTYCSCLLFMWNCILAC
jgi:hypothetical protein